MIYTYNFDETSHSGLNLGHVHVELIYNDIRSLPFLITKNEKLSMQIQILYELK